VTSWLRLDRADIRYTTHENSSGRIANVIFSINAPFAESFSSAIQNYDKNMNAPHDQPHNGDGSEQ
jgi:hypothetical protein